MSFFENFPYTNLHNLNLDWIISIIKEFKEKYPDIITEIEKKIDKPLIDPVGNFGEFLMSNGDGTTKWNNISASLAEEIEQAVAEWLEEHPEATTTVEDGSITPVKFNNEVYTLPFKYPCNVVAEFPTSLIQGGTWIANNKYVFATPIGNNMCTLYEWDHSLNRITRTADIECYHGNSIAYDPESGFLYIADCLDDQGNELNTITVVNYSNFAYIRRITAPVSAIVSLAYDRATSTFYSTNARGTTPGVSNALYEYNGVFESIKRIIVLDDLTVNNIPHYSNQGVHCVVNNIAYLLYYEPSRTIIGYNLETGEKNIIANIPTFMNGYKYAGEIEAITYNEYTDSYIVFSNSFAFEIGLFKNINILELNFGSINSGNNEYYTVLVQANTDPVDTRPALVKDPIEPLFCSVTDAVNAGRYNNVALNIIIESATPVTYTEQIKLIGFKGRLSGRIMSGERMITLNKGIEAVHSQCVISDLIFDTSVTPVNNACISARSCTILVLNVLFNTTNTSYNILAFFGSTLQTVDNTYSKENYVSRATAYEYYDKPVNIAGSEFSLNKNTKTVWRAQIYDNETFVEEQNGTMYDMGNIILYRWDFTINNTISTMLQLRNIDGIVIGGDIRVNNEHVPTHFIQLGMGTPRIYPRPNITGTGLRVTGWVLVNKEF